MVNVKFMALREATDGTVQVASGIVLDCPSVEELESKLEGMGAVVISAEIATDDEVANGYVEE